ncbi:MAG: hypothetical protein V1787_06780 [Candidatus Micrarchaeota archaeon]
MAENVGEKKQYSKKLVFYKATKSLSGSAVQFDLNAQKEAVFLELSRQKGEREFDWQNKLSFKLAAADIGKLLLVLKRRVPSIELFHDPGKGGYSLGEIARNNTLSFSRDDKSGRFSIRVGQQAADGSVNSISAFLSEDEALLLELMLGRALERIYGW